MPTPSLNTVMQMAYAEAQRLAALPNPDPMRPEARAAVEQLWAIVKERLSLDDERTKALDALIAKVVGRGDSDGKDALR